MYRIYFTDPNRLIAIDAYDRETLSEALTLCEKLRKEGKRMVTMVAEDLNQVGKPGVGGVTHGKLPDGTVYDWTKNDRVGAAFKSGREY